MGERNAEGARRTVRVALCLAVCYGIGNACIIMSVRHVWGRVFTSDPEVLALVERWLPLLVMYSAWDAMQVGNEPL
jgi:MATE family multidrug resistance protein